jgi:glutamine synthetase
MLDRIEKSVSDKKVMSPDEKAALKLDIGKIPEILLDNTDRNRTSPFAFTGNRFEFRAVGSSANCASPIIVLNTIMANQLNEFYKDVMGEVKKGIKKDEAIFRILRKYIKQARKVVFEGNGYSEEWVKEAEKRGLTNINEVTESLKAFISDKTVKVMEKNAILSRRELDARYEIRLDVFKKKIQIESRVLGDLAVNHIIPTAIKYQNVLIQNVMGMRELLNTGEFNRQAGLQLETLKEISGHISSIREKVDAMVEARKKANKIDNLEELAVAYQNDVMPFLDDIRRHIDKLELIIDDEIWPLPKYREMLFIS